MIYLDNAATTPYLKSEMWGNPSSLYKFGVESKDFIDECRHELAQSINANDNEIYFTSGGTEADNWALKGILKPGDHIITSKIEHHAILNTCRYLEKIGVSVTYLDVDEFGVIESKTLEDTITPSTKLISIMMGNNEIGTIQNIKELGRIAHNHNVLFHTDAVQCFGHIPIDVENMNIDLMSVSGHKFGAQKGIGFLYIRNGVEIEPLIHGGQQEHGMRAGTENIDGIKSLVEGFRHYNKLMKLDVSVDYLLHKLSEIKKDIRINGRHDLPIVSITLPPNVYSEMVVYLLGEKNICISGGSACNSSSNEPSHVLRAIGLTDDEASRTIRISLNQHNTKEDIDEFISELVNCINYLERC